MLADHQTLIDDLVRDIVGRLGEAARDRAFGLALIQYGKDKPRRIVSDLVCLDGEPRRLPLPDGWNDDASEALSIEYPIGYLPARLLPKHTWATQRSPDGTILAVPDPVLIGGQCRLTWTLPHLADDTTDTVPTADREAVAQYAAAILLDQVAAMTSGDQDSTIKADSVDHGRSGPNYAERARTARQRYHDLLGIDPNRQQPASITVQAPLRPTTAFGRLTMGRRYHG